MSLSQQAYQDCEKFSPCQFEIFLVVCNLLVAILGAYVLDVIYLTALDLFRRIGGYRTLVLSIHFVIDGLENDLVGYMKLLKDQVSGGSSICTKGLLSNPLFEKIRLTNPGVA